MGRKLLAGILGGLAFFAWSSIAHVFTGLAQTGVQEIPNEEAVLSSMKANLPTADSTSFPAAGCPMLLTRSKWPR